MHPYRAILCHDTNLGVVQITPPGTVRQDNNNNNNNKNSNHKQLFGAQASA